MLIKKRLGQIADGNNAWLKLVNNDTGRMHGDVVTNGCITGRCSHRNPNTAQILLVTHRMAKNVVLYSMHH